MTVRTLFFRVDGADRDTGEDTYLVLQAGSKPEAETIARKQGILISSIRVAKPQDWTAKAAPPAPTEPEIEPPPSAKIEPAPAPPPATEVAPEVASAPPPAVPVVSLRRRVRVPIPVVFLTCVGGLLELAGLATLLVGLIPDHGLRNELQQLDQRLRLLNLIILSSTLILSGLLVLLIAAVWFFADTRANAARQ